MNMVSLDGNWHSAISDDVLHRLMTMELKAQTQSTCDYSTGSQGSENYMC